MYDGKVCDARFYKACGGATELFENAWANEHYPYLEPVRDEIGTPLPDLTIEENAQAFIRTSPSAYCNTTDERILSQVLNNYDQETKDFYRWTVQYTKEELSEIIRERSGIDFGEILDLVPIKRGPSARLYEMQIVGSKRTMVIGKELEIRKWLSKSHLYSSAFVVDRNENGDFILTGAGWGHGVGLCQIGAAVMADKGYTYEQILAHYFPGSELKVI
jgi:SpoIID/LytB domain protein